MRKEKEFGALLLHWYDSNRRKLPWRDDPTPFRVWISEIMLQQTQVRTVLPYYARFLKRFSDVTKLARAREEEILRLWAGLGYYRRARNLHRAAKIIVSEFGGEFPARYDEILKLPGVGRYTAGAISAIAFGERRPAVDGNVMRVISRLHALQSRPPASWFWRKSASWIPDERVSDFTQALMELGALVCTPARPQCAGCPATKLCKSSRMPVLRQTQRTKGGGQVERVQMVVVVARSGRRMLLAKLRDGFIPGRWGLPHRVVPAGAAVEDVARQVIAIDLGSEAPVHLQGKVRHAISRRRITATVFSAALQDQEQSEAAYSWTSHERADQLLTSSIFRKAIRLAGAC